MNIADLFENAPNLEVDSIMTDSRKPAQRGIFFCIQGMVHDGHDFVGEAIDNGAICIVHSKEIEEIRQGITYLMVDDTIQALNEFTAAFFDNCTQNMTVYGVTGSNGKSSVASLTRYVVNNIKKCGYISSFGFVDEKTPLLRPQSNTMDIVSLHSICHQMYEYDCKAISIEASSVGLEECRYDSIDFDIVSFTNLTPEHLDYHGDIENYFRAKTRLFTDIASDKTAIINIDDEFGQRLFREEINKKVSYAIKQAADYRAVDINLAKDHTEFNLLYKGVKYHVYTNLVAMFNIYNALNVIAVLHEDGYPFEEFLPWFKSVPAVPGRMEQVDVGQPFNIIIDYAKSADGFRKVMEFAKTITPHHNRIIAVFGSEGGRDARKSEQLGLVADEYCKMIILTSQDPKKESPEAIAEHIRANITNNVSIFIEDRYSAIEQAISLANPKDTVLILGKGDEKFMYVQGNKEPWIGDKQAVEEIYDELFNEEGELSYEFK